MLNVYALLPLWLSFLISLFLIIGATEVGRRLGHRVAAQKQIDIGPLQGSVFGLLALMIGFTFAMSLSHFDSRREAVLIEANSIGTAALRARLLPQPYASESLALLREYVDARLSITRGVPTENQLRAVIDRSREIHEKLWQQAKAIAEKDNALVPTGLFIQALNELIDNQEKRLSAVFNRIPPIVFITLYGIAVVAAGFNGYSTSLNGGRSHIPSVIMGILLSAVILLIQDLDLPGKGFISVSQQPMIDTANSLAGYH